ncbi:MAG: tetratricopeptide repeat protein [Bacteroidota bacterium]
MTKVKETKEEIVIPVVTDQESVYVDPLDRAEFLFRSNMKLLGYITAGIFAIGAVVAGYMYWQSEQNGEAQKELFHAVYQFESDSLKQALNGNGNHWGLLRVADEFSGTDAANQAEFYIGAAFLKQGKFKEAVEHLNKFKSSDALVQARAYCLLGDANLELNQADEAISFYRKAAEHKPNKQFTPGYLMKLALAQTVAKDTKGASETYSKVVEEYPESAELSEAKRLKVYYSGE